MSFVSERGSCRTELFEKLPNKVMSNVIVIPRDQSNSVAVLPASNKRSLLVCYDIAWIHIFRSEANETLI